MDDMPLSCICRREMASICCCFSRGTFDSCRSLFDVIMGPPQRRQPPGTGSGAVDSTRPSALGSLL